MSDASERSEQGIAVGILIDPERVVEYRDNLTHWLDHLCTGALNHVSEVIVEALRDLNSLAPDEGAQATIDMYDDWGIDDEWADEQSE
jgi:hypothetical protein